MKTILKRVLISIILIYLGFGFLLFLRQDDYIYYSSAQDFDSCQEFSDSEKLDLNGTRAYYKKIPDRLQANQQISWLGLPMSTPSVKLIVFYHGNGGSACESSFLKDTFANLGYSYIFAEYAGYSNDARKPSQELIMEDVKNINDFLNTLTLKELAIAGESLGASAALYHSSIADEDKLLLISPFYSLADSAKIHYPLYPIALLLRDKYENYLWLNDIKKVEIIHGTKDTIIPIGESKRLFDKMEVADKKFIEISGADHNYIYSYPETFQEITDFLK